MTRPNLLDALWPQGRGLFALADNRGHPTITVANISSEALAGDVWFTPAVFRPDADRRAQSEVMSVHAFWCDLDPTNSTPDLASMVSGVVRFCEAVGLPLPHAVSSGRGLHVYWQLSEGLEPLRWKSLAKRFARLLRSKGLEVDPSRTTDHASLMRLPGSHHCKAAPVLVEQIAEQNEPLLVEEFVAVLDKHVPDTKPDSKMKSLIDVERVPLGDPDAIIRKCAAMSEVVQSPGQIEEPQWYAVLGVLTHCEDGEFYAERMSELFDESSAKRQKWRQKWERAQEFGPSTCERFSNLTDACTTCPLRGKITSPVQAARVIPQPEQVVEAPEAPAKLEIPEQLRSLWSVSDAGVWYNPVDSEDEGAMKVLGVPLWVTQVGEVFNEGAVAQVTWKTPVGTLRQGEMPLTALGDLAKLREWLLNNAITDFSPGGKGVARYIRDFTTEILNRADPSKVVHRMGWLAEGEFFIGTEKFSSAGKETVRVAKSFPRRQVEGMQAKGTLEEWLKAVGTLDLEIQWPAAFTLLASLGSPLLHLMGVQGSVLSLTGTSGLGKTTAASLALSAWGDPAALTISPQGTLNSKGEIMRLANNLPVAVDDFGRAHAKQLSELVYMAANGRAKERLTRAGTVKGQEDWQLLVIVTTNDPILEMPESILGEAERRRVVELSWESALPMSDAAVIHDTIKTSHGHAGRALISHIARNPAQFAREANRQVTEMLTAYEIPEANRFGLWTAAAAYVAGKVAHDIGVLPFDPKPVIEKALEALADTSTAMVADEDRIEDLIAAFVNANSGRFSIKRARRFTYGDQIRGEVVGTIALDAREVLIPIYRVKEWLSQHGVPMTAYRAWRKAENITDKVTVMNINGARERCLVVPMTVEWFYDFEGMLEGQESE